MDQKVEYGKWLDTSLMFRMSVEIIPETTHPAKDETPSNRIQKNVQLSSGCQIFIIDLPLLRQSKLGKFLELCIVYVLKNATVEGLCLSQSMPYELKTLLKLLCCFLKYDVESKSFLRLVAVEP